MSRNQPTRGSSFTRTIRKFFVSAFVVFTFLIYALHQRTVSQDAGVAAAPSDPPGQPSGNSPQGAPTDAQPTAPAGSQQTAPTEPPPLPSPTAKPAPKPTAIAQNSGQYKNGTYTGPSVDAFYGIVQVQVSIQGGKIANVQFLQYPNDRRTSVRINTTVMPWLTSEAVQAQSANVDIISGATLTSQAFAESLQTALDAAKS